jgi:hypothetical protein
MTFTRPRPTRSATLWTQWSHWSGSSSFTPQPALRLCLRKSLAGHWTLVDTESHKSLYYISTHRSETVDSVHEIRRGSSDGTLLATVSKQLSESQCWLTFADGGPEIRLKLPGKISIGRKPRFEVKGRQWYWKRDIVCRDSGTRRVCAGTDDGMLLVYEGSEDLLDILAVGLIATQFKYQ